MSISIRWLCNAEHFFKNARARITLSSLKYLKNAALADGQGYGMIEEVMAVRIKIGDSLKTEPDPQMFPDQAEARYSPWLMVGDDESSCGSAHGK